MGDLGYQKAEGKPNQNRGCCVQIVTSCGQPTFTCTVDVIDNSIACLSREGIKLLQPRGTGLRRNDDTSDILAIAIVMNEQLHE
jgi:hypothetical protein